MAAAVKRSGQKNKTRSRNPWTNTFVRLTEALIRDYRDKVEIISEFELFKRPMRIDAVIIKLEENVVIDNAMMRFFRARNIVEFKGPYDALDIDAFDRTISYFYAYLSKERGSVTPPLKFDDLTITMVSVNKPHKTLEILREERKYKIIDTHTPGIHYIIRGDDCASEATQLIVTSELPRHWGDESLLWLNSVREKLRAEEVREILELVENLDKDDPFSDVLNFIVNVNPQVSEEVDEMTLAQGRAKNRKYLRKWAIREGVFDEWKMEGMREALDLIRSGYSVDDAEKILAAKGQT